jgi:hypothetical protein
MVEPMLRVAKGPTAGAFFRLSSGRLRLPSLAAVILAACVGTGGCARPWTDLHQRFATVEPPPAASRRGQSVRLSGRGGFPKSVSYGGAVVYACDTGGVYLDVGKSRGSVRIPVSAVGFCSRSIWESSRSTNVWVPDAGVEISLPDNDESIISWCREQKVRIVDRATAIRLVHER